MKTGLKVVLVGAVLVGGVMTLKSRGHHAATTDGTPGLVANRIWIDHMPKGPRDAVQIFVLVDKQKFGIYDRMSHWKGEFERFRYQQEGSVVRAEFPQTGDKESIKTHATECRGDDRDFCLELSGSSRGVTKYFSQDDWIVRGELTERQLEDAVTAKLDAIYSTAK